MTGVGEGERFVAWGQELRQVHVRLRAAVARAREAAESGDPTQSPAGELLLYCHGFCAALTDHHRSEDAALFPVIEQARPDLGPVLATLTEDHGLLAGLIEDLEQAVGAGADAEHVLRHLDGIEAIMESHFGYEERRLIAVLDALHDDSLVVADLFGTIS